jgi:hypothetical protein
MIVGNAHRVSVFVPPFRRLVLDERLRESATETILILDFLTGSKVKRNWMRKLPVPASGDGDAAANPIKSKSKLVPFAAGFDRCG